MPILPFAILGILLAIAAAFWTAGAAKLKRLRALHCPSCQRPFTVPNLGQVKRWMTVSMDKNQSSSSGFTLHCEKCSADFRFTDSLEPLD
jgi:hypothetical protein